MNSHEIDRLRSSYHYYRKKPDLLSICRSEVIKEEIERLKSINKTDRESEKKRVFLKQYPEYKERLK